MSGSAIQLLPNEVIENIFQHLLLSERICLRSVCARWQEVLQGMLRKQDRLCIGDEPGPCSTACFAGHDDHAVTPFDCIPLIPFKRMILSNSVTWLTTLMPNLKIISSNLRMTTAFIKPYNRTLECLQCDFVDDAVWRMKCPSLIHISARNLEDHRFAKSCPHVQVIRCWGSFAYSSLYNGLFPINRKTKLIGFTTDTMDNIAKSPVAQSLKVLRFYDYNEEAKGFHMPCLTHLTMTGFRSNSDRSRKILLTSISKSQQLTHLHLICTGMLAGEWITMLSKLSHSLRSVTLKVQEEVVIFIAGSMKQLEEVTIYNGKLTDASVNAMSSMEHLNHISLIRPDVLELASKITAEGILTLLRGHSRSTLRHVAIESRSLKTCPELTNELRLMSEFEQLSSYRITDCKKLTWMKSMASVSGGRQLAVK